MNKIIKQITENVMCRLKNNINEDIKRQFPKTIKSQINQIYKEVNKYKLSGKKYHDDHWQALRDYNTVIEDILGYDFSYWCENGGYGDYDEYTHMPMSKTYEIRISCGEDRDIEGYIKMMAAGSVEDPFDAYDTCIVMWPAIS